MARRVEIPSPEADALVASAIAGDSNAFADLFEITRASVYRFLYSRCGDATVAEDLMQDSYIRAMRAIGTSFVGGSREFIAWMIRIARNRFLDHLKSGRVRWEVVVDETPIVRASGETEGDALALVEGAVLRSSLDKLTTEQQEILYLRFFQGLAIAEVAVVTKRTEGAIKAMQFRALRALGKILAAEGVVDMPEGGSR